MLGVRLRWVVFFLILLTACGGPGEIELVQGDGDLIFPVRETDPGGPDGEIFGELTLVGDCLRVRELGTDDLIIWVDGFSYERSDDTVSVVDESGELVVTTGDRIHLAGGEMTRGGSEEGFEEVREAVGDECPGPYWMTEEVLDVSGPAG